MSRPPVTPPPRRCSVPAILLALLACTPVSLSSGGEIYDLHQKWVRPKEADTGRQQKRFEALEMPTHGVTEIGMERTACHGVCPMYTVVFNRDGTFRYVGEDNVARKGKHTGRISTDQFNQLAEFVIESGYMNLDATYDLPRLADFPATYTMAVVGKKRKLVKNYGDLGPVKLWALQQSIDSLLAGAEWDNGKLKSFAADDLDELKP